MFFTDPVAANIEHRARLVEARQARTPYTREPASRRRASAGRRFLTRLIPSRSRRLASAGLLTDSHELFVGHDHTQLTRLEQFFTVVEVPAGASLGRQGHVAHEFVTILRGQVGVTIDGVPHAVLDDGSHFGEVALLSDRPKPTHSATLTAMTPTRIARTSAADFHSMLSEFPLVAERVRAMCDIRRAYLAGLAHADLVDRSLPAVGATDVFPVHAHERRDPVASPSSGVPRFQASQRLPS